MVGGSLWVLRLPPPLAEILLNGVKTPKIKSNHKLLISIRKPFIINVPLNEKKAQVF
jgi:hypothetical protein